MSQFSFAKLRQPTGQTFFPNFPREFYIYFKPKVAIAKFFWKILGLDAMPLSLKNLLLTDVQQNPGRKSNGLYLKLMIVSPSQFDMVLLLLSGTEKDKCSCKGL